jgi:hypothetical protein
MNLKFEPNTEYRVVSVELNRIEDVWEEGQVGQFDSRPVDWIKVQPTEFLGDMVTAIEESFFGGPSLSVDIWENRITVNTLVDENGCEASKGQIDEWMWGNLQLWNEDYEFAIEKVTIDSELDLSEIIAEENQI